MVGGGVFHSVEIYRRPIRRFSHCFESYFLDLDINFRRGRIGEELVDSIFSLVLFHRVVGQLAIEKIQSIGEVVVNGVAIAAVIEAAKFGQEILGLAVSREIFEALVIDRLGASKLINTNDQRAEILESPDGFQVQNDQTRDGKTQQGHGDFKIVAGDNRVAVLLEVELFGF